MTVPVNPRKNTVVLYDPKTKKLTEMDAVECAKFLAAEPMKQQRMSDKQVNSEINKICSEIHLQFLSDGNVLEKLKFLIDYLIDCKEIDVTELTDKLLDLIHPAEAVSICSAMNRFNYLTYKRTFDDIRFKIISEFIQIYEDIEDDENFEHL